MIKGNFSNNLNYLRY